MNARVRWLLSRPSTAETSSMKWCWHGDRRPSRVSRLANSQPSVHWPTLEERPLTLPRARPGRQHPADERDKSHSTFVEPSTKRPRQFTWDSLPKISGPASLAAQLIDRHSEDTLIHDGLAQRDAVSRRQSLKGISILAQGSHRRWIPWVPTPRKSNPEGIV